MKNPNDKRKFQIPRREFCKNTALISGGILLSPLSISNSAYAAGDDKLKLALIGCGGRGTGASSQALTADKNVQLVAMADAFQDRLDKSLKTLSEKYQNTNKIAVPKDQQFIGFDAYKHAIDIADVVILTTPPGFRPYHFEYAIQSGKHVFMEKPVATDAPGVRKVLETAKLAKQKKLNVVVGLQRHYEISYLELLKRIQDDMVGQIVSGQVYWNSEGVWVRERKPEQTEMEYQMRNWYYFTWLCGDHIVEQHIHNIDVANWFIGDYPVSAQGMGGREVRTGKEYGEIFDHHFVEFTYPSGAVISSQCRHQPGTMTRVQEIFQGTKGHVTTYKNINISNHKGKVLYHHDDKDDPNPYQTEHDELFKSIRKGGVINNVDYGAKSTMTAIMGRMATYSGQVINWQDALNSNISLQPQKIAWNADPQSIPNKKGYYAIPVPGKTVAV